MPDYAFGIGMIGLAMYMTMCEAGIRKKEVERKKNYDSLPPEVKAAMPPFMNTPEYWETSGRGMYVAATLIACLGIYHLYLSIFG